MNPLIVLGIVSVLPVVLILLMRINAALVFLALCAGSVLQQYLGDDVLRIFNSFIPSSSQALHAAVRIGFLILPAGLTLLFMRKTISGTRHALNFVPALLTGVVTAILVVPLLPDGSRYAVLLTDAWTNFEPFQGLIVGAAALTSFVFLWSTNRGHGGKKKH